jgi:hypothetical protein
MSWQRFPWDARRGEGPLAGDTPPERTPEGDFVFYHGASSSSAAHTMAQHVIAPVQVLGRAVGVATTPEAAAMKAAGPLLRVVVKPDTLAHYVARHEAGGSGHDQFLIARPDSAPAAQWPGLPVADAQVVTPGRPSVALAKRLSAAQRRAVDQYTTPGGTRAINDPLRADEPLTVNALEDGYATVRHLDAAIAKSVVDVPGTVYRGLGRRPGEVPWKAGDELPADPGYTSATGDPTMAEQFAILRATGGAPGTGLLGVKYDPHTPATGGAPVILAIHLREGQHALAGDPSVDEFVLMRGSALKATGVTRKVIPDWQRQPLGPSDVLPPAGSHEAEFVDVEVSEPAKPPPLPAPAQALGTDRAARRAATGEPPPSVPTLMGETFPAELARGLERGAARDAAAARADGNRPGRQARAGGMPGRAGRAGPNVRRGR